MVQDKFIPKIATLLEVGVLEDKLKIETDIGGFKFVAFDISENAVALNCLRLKNCLVSFRIMTCGAILERACVERISMSSFVSCWNSKHLIVYVLPLYFLRYWLSYLNWNLGIVRGRCHGHSS